MINSDIIVGVDGSAPAKVAVCWAAREAAMRNVGLRLVTAIGAPISAWTASPIPIGFSRWQEQQARKHIAEAI